MLIDAGVARQPMASVERHNFASPFFAGGEHLHDRRVGHELHRRASGGGIERNRRWRRGIHYRSFWRDHFDGIQRAVVLRQIIGERAENRLITSAEGRVIRQIDALLGLRAGAGEVEKQAVAFFAERHVYFPSVAGVNTAGVTPCPIGNLGNTFAQNRFGIVQHFLRHCRYELGAELLVQRLHSRLRHIVRRESRT